MRSARSSVPMLLLLLTVGGCFERTQPSVEAAVRPVLANRVQLAPDQEWRAYDGVIRARREADLAFRAAGRIVSREVDLGARVTEGQVLARLDPADLTLSVRSAEADLAAARSQSAQASSDATRSRSLVAGGWVAAATDEIKQATATASGQRVASAKAALEIARNRLDYAALRAPKAGIVTGLLADPGTVVAEGQAVLRLAEAGVPEAEVALPESALGSAHAEQASATFWSHPGVRLPVRLRELSPTADRGLRTYVARYSIADAPPWLMQGMTATVHLPADGDGASVATLPSAALADRGQGPMVWLVTQGDSVPKPQPVTVRRIAGQRAVVTGLRDGDLVVSLGVQKLDPAARVRVADIRPVVD